MNSGFLGPHRDYYYKTVFRKFNKTRQKLQVQEYINLFLLQLQIQLNFLKVHK